MQLPTFAWKYQAICLGPMRLARINFYEICQTCKNEMERGKNKRWLTMRQHTPSRIVISGTDSSRKSAQILMEQYVCFRSMSSFCNNYWKINFSAWLCFPFVAVPTQPTSKSQPKKCSILQARSFRCGALNHCQLEAPTLRNSSESPIGIVALRLISLTKKCFQSTSSRQMPICERGRIEIAKLPQIEQRSVRCDCVHFRKRTMLIS